MRAVVEYALGGPEFSAESPFRLGLTKVNADGSGLFRVTNTPDIEEFSAEWGTHPVTP